MTVHINEPRVKEKVRSWYQIKEQDDYLWERVGVYGTRAKHYGTMQDSY